LYPATVITISTNVDDCHYGDSSYTRRSETTEQQPSGKSTGPATTGPCTDARWFRRRWRRLMPRRSVQWAGALFELVLVSDHMHRSRNLTESNSTTTKRPRRGALMKGIINEYLAVYRA
jgi:hypothetical protein